MKPLTNIDNVTARFTGWMQNLGHQVINLLARFGEYQLVQDIAYGHDVRQQLDYYQTRADHAGLIQSLVLFIYGGAWEHGDKRSFRFVADSLCAMGCDVVVIDYRLYPQVRFPQMMSDVVAAGRWVAENTPAEQPVYVMGHSAGAHLGSLLCLNKTLLVQAGNLAERLQGFVGMAGPYDYFPYTEDTHWDLFGPKENYPLSRTINFVRADGPPLYLLHGEDDTRVRRGHSKSLMEKTRAVGGVANREVYENMGHVDIIVAFSVLHRRNSPVMRDIARFIFEPARGSSQPEDDELQVNTNH